MQTMDRQSRVLGHIKSGSKTFSRQVPAAAAMQEGEERYVLVSGTLRLYTKQGGQLFYAAFTKVS